MTDHISSVTDSTFDVQVLQAQGPVLVDFWAEWCSPCKQVLPIIDELAEQYAGEVLIYKINADDNEHSTTRFNVRGFPTMILFVDGVEKERLLGAMSKTRIAALLDRHIRG